MSSFTDPTATRKADHIRINLEENVRSGLTTGLERYRFQHRALPNLNLSEVDTQVTVFGKTLRVPLLISSMTGGTPSAQALNHTLAQAAQQAGLAMGVGSQRAALENPALADTFRVRQVAPDILLFANVGAVQLNYGYGVEHCRRAVEMIEADALILHFNALQEAVQPEGDGNFAGLIDKVHEVCHQVGVPVIAKEVGWGFGVNDLLELREAGVSAVDVAGAGGTSWSQVEMHRAPTALQRAIAGAFLDWGIPTAEAIQHARQVVPHLPIFASGGLRDGLDAAKCLALGASLCGYAGPLLKAAAVSLEATLEKIQELERVLRIAMFAAGVPSISHLQHTDALITVRD